LFLKWIRGFPNNLSKIIKEYGFSSGSSARWSGGGGVDALILANAFTQLGLRLSACEGECRQITAKRLLRKGLLFL
jgi:hypothetical protein